MKSLSSVTEKVYQAFIVCAVIAVSLLSLFPLLYVISTSLVSNSEYIERGGFILWPWRPTLAPYINMLSQPYFINSLLVSVLRTVVGTAVVLSLSSLTAYILSRRNMPGSRAMLFCILVTILFNAGLIPSFLVVYGLGLKNTLWAMIIPGAIDGWSVLVLKQFFENIPMEIEESAVMDGIGKITLMTRIVLPLSLPALAAIGLFTAVGHWNAWFDAMIYIDDYKMMPLQLFIRNMFHMQSVSNLLLGNINPAYSVSTETLRMSLVVAATLPILCVYPFLQKYFIKGMYLGAVKG